MSDLSELPLKEVRGKPKLHHLHLFYRFYRLLQAGMTVEHAVPHLGIHKTALYRILDALEKEVCPGDFLVERSSGKPCRTTPLGDRFYAQLPRLFALYLETVAPDRAGRNVLTLGATNAVITYWLPVVLRLSDFLQKHPDTDVHLFEGERFQILNELTSGRIAFGWGPEVPASPKYQLEHLVDLKRAIVFHPDHKSFRRFRQGEPFDFDCLASETVFMLTETGLPNYELAKTLPAPTPGQGRRITVPNFAQLSVFVKYDLGVGIAHLEHWVPGDEHGLIEKIDVSDKLGVTPVYLYLPVKKELLSQAALDLIGSIKATADRIRSEPWPALVEEILQGLRGEPKRDVPPARKRGRGKR